MPTTAAPMLILGSASPRRREILTSIRVPFRVVVAEADERPTADESPLPYLERVVLAKLLAVRTALANDASSYAGILVADTSVIVDNDILGKPANAEDAATMLRRLSGRSHDVSTRFALADSNGNVLHGETVTTKVTFRPIPNTSLLRYAASGEGFDKAGGYAVQGGAQAFVSRIEGSYSNVVGLPASEVALALEAFGFVESDT